MYDTLIEVFLKERTRFNFYNIFLNSGKAYSEVLSDLSNRGVSKPVRQLGNNIDKVLSDLPIVVERYLKGEIPEVISRDYGCSRTSLNDVLRCLGKLRSIRESRRLLIKNPSYIKNLSEKARQRSEQNLKLYGSAIVVTDPLTGKKCNVSKTEFGREKQRKISHEKIQKFGYLCPVTTSDGTKVHVAKTEAFKRKAFKVWDPDLGFVNYRKTAKGRLESSITRSEYNLKDKINNSEYDLYLIETLDFGFKVGITHNFAKRRVAYFGNPNFKPKRVRVCRCYSALHHEHEIKVLTVKYGVKYFDYGITGTSEWRNLTPELLDDVERYIIENNLTFNTIFPEFND